MKQITWQKSLGYLALCILAFLGNRFSIPFFFGVDFIFGSIFVFIILCHFGFLAAIPAVLISSSYTYLLWNHPYAIIIFSAELLVTGALFHRFRRNLVLLDTLFWAVIGIPLVYLFYGQVMGLPGQSVVLIMLKQSVNGLFNALVAFIFVTFSPLLFKKEGVPAKSVSFKNLIFILLLISLSIPVLVIIVVLARNEFRDIRNNIVQELETTSVEVHGSINDWLQHRVLTIHEVSAGLQNQAIKTSCENQSILKFALSVSPDFHNIYIADKNGITRAFYPPVNAKGESTIGLDFSDRDYFKQLQNGRGLVISNVFQGRGGVFSPIVTISAPILRQSVFNGFTLGVLKITQIENIIKRVSNNRLGGVTVIDGNGKIVASTLPERDTLASFDWSDHWDIVPVDNTIYQGFRKSDADLSLMRRWNNSVFFKTVPAPINKEWRIIVEIRTNHYIRILDRFYITSLFFIFILSVGAVVLSSFVANLMVRALLQLQQASSDLPGRIDKDELIQWPASFITEINGLISNFKVSENQLASSFERLTESHNMLEKRVAERTRELSDSRNRIQTIINTAEDGIISIDRFGKVGLFNRAAERIFQYSEGEVVGQNVKMLMPAKTREEYDSYIRRYLDTNEARIIGIGREVTGLRKDGSVFPMRLAIGEMKKDEDRIFVGVITDITEQKEIEMDLIQSKEEAEAANLAKSKFLANMSHEIRTPMNAIIGFSNLLKPLVKDQQETSYLDAIETAGNNLLMLINDILDLSKIEAGRLELQKHPTSLAKIFSEMEQIFSPRILEKRLNFQTDIAENVPDPLYLDETRIRQVLLNLVGNAVKFTHKGSIKLGVRRLDEGKQAEQVNLEIMVEDTGVGIEADKLELIFDAFGKQDSHFTTRYGGAGLGITISQRLVQIMNGSIKVSSQVGSGSTFKVILNDVTVPDREQFETQDDTPGGIDYRTLMFKPATVLVVDDTESNRVLINEILKRKGITAVEAENGQKGFERAKQLMPDLIIMDLRMPVLNGYQATEKIKQDPATSKIPVIGLTANVSEITVPKMQKSGFDGYLIKPLEEKKLVYHLSRFLENVEPSDPPVPAREKEIPSPLSPSGKNLDVVIQQLEREMLPMWNELAGAMDMDEISTFAESLAVIAEKHGVDILSDYVGQLTEAVSSFDIRKLENELGRFTDILNSLKQVTYEK